MRRSVSYNPANAYIISAALDKESQAKLKKLCKLTGHSMSRMIRTLIMGARLNTTHKIQEAAQESQVRHWTFSK